MSAESTPLASPAVDPQTWVDLLTVHALKGDVFSTRTLTVIHEGVEKLAKARAADNGIVITNFHVTLFERLLRSFNNPNLLKEIGVAYLEEFRIPAMALKHFELACEFAPKDRDIEQLQVAAALAVARQMTDQSAHSGLDEAAPSKPEVESLIRKTTKLAHVVDTRTHLDETAGEMGRKQEVWRKTGGVKQVAATPVADFQETLDRIQDLILQNDFAGAAAALDEACQAGAPKEELQAYYAQLGLTAYDHGRMEEALDAFQHMRDLGPEAVEGWFNCGLVHHKMGRLDDALASYQEAVRIGPDNPKTWCNLSAVRLERGDHAEAEKAARRSLELKNDYARAWDNLASALGAMNRLPEAAEACQRAIHLQPALYSAWFKFGVVNFQLDNLVVATEAFNMTAESPDFFSYVLYYNSMIESRRGELDLAVEKLEQARASDPDNELESNAIKELGAAFTRAGDHISAAGYYEEITKKYTDDFSAWLALGTARHRSEQVDQAREAYLRATGLQPNNPLPWHNLGLLASDQGRHEESRDYFKHEVELAPDDAKAWYDYGVSLQALGQEEESARAFEQAEGLVKSLTRRSSDLSAALSIVRRLNLGDRVLKTE
ncbi:MAG: tetratricopeptide repeat protein [Methylacidiphilales bacterium]|nr:tetratricopeptide repeat protein [Candidatus Methylacidiphilales bacterium]